MIRQHSQSIRPPAPKPSPPSTLALNQMRRPLSALDLFKAALAAEDKDSLLIVDCLASAGLSLASHTNYLSWKPRQLANIGGIKRALSAKGEPVLRMALSALAKAWPDEILRFGGSVFPGFVAVSLDEFRLRSEPERTVGELSTLAGSYPQEDWRRMGEMLVAQKGGGRNEAMEAVFRDAWRSRHSTRPITPVIEPEEDDDQDSIWCSQCDRRVSSDKAARCASPFCKAKAQAA